jgi:glutamyl-tRNA synthetase
MLRFAPSPTGDMHIGNLRVAIFNYIVSKQRDEGLIIRIEDTDKERNIEGKDKEILEILNLFSIEYKSVFYQSDNLKDGFAAYDSKESFCLFL